MADVTLKAVLMGEDRSLSKTMKGAGKSVEDVGTKAKGAGDMMKGALGADVVMGAADAIVDFGRTSVDAYAELEDSTAAASVVFGKNMGAIIKQSETANAKLGMSKQQVINAANVFGTYGKAAGKSGKDLADFSTQMTSVAGDMASFKGTSPEQAIEAVGAALRGETEPIRAYGVMLDDAGMRQTALKMGLIKTTKEALTPQQKALAAQKMILEQTKDAQGDFARTANSTSNVMKTQKAKFEDASAAIGEKLAPVMTRIVDIGSQVIDWISQNVSWLGPLAMGIGIVAAAFMALNAVMALNPFVLIVVAIGALVGGLIYAYQNVEWFRNGVNAAFNAIGAVARWLWNNALAPALRGIVKGFAWVIGGLANMLDALGNVKGFGWAKDAAKGLRGVADGATKAADSIKDIPDPVVNTNPAKKRVDDLKGKINSIKGKIVEAKAKGDDRAVVNLKRKLDSLKKQYNIAMNVYKTGISTIRAVPSGGGLTVRAVALGGGVRKGNPYWVGENGPELFWPGANGHINNQFQLQNAMRGGSTSNTATTNNYITLTAPAGAPNAWAAEAEKALVQLMKSRGAGGKLQFQRG